MFLLQASTQQPETWQAALVAVVSALVGGGALKLVQTIQSGAARRQAAEQRHELARLKHETEQDIRATEVLRERVQALEKRLEVVEKHADDWRTAAEECERRAAANAAAWGQQKVTLETEIQGLRRRVGELEDEVRKLMQHDVAPKPARRPRKPEAKEAIQ